MEPHFIILIPCSRGSIYKWQVCAFYSQLSLIYLSKRVHLQSALSVGYRRADINEAFRFIRLAAWQATRGSIDFFGSVMHFFLIFLRITMRNMPGELDRFVGLIYQPPPSPLPLFHSNALSLFFGLSLALSPLSLFPSSQRKSSYLNWPQEPLLSDFNAPYSVDSISITPVTKD